MRFKSVLILTFLIGVSAFFVSGPSHAALAPSSEIAEDANVSGDLLELRDLIAAENSVVERIRVATYGHWRYWRRRWHRPRHRHWHRPRWKRCFYYWWKKKHGRHHPQAHRGKYKHHGSYHRKGNRYKKYHKLRRHKKYGGYGRFRGHDRYKKYRRYVAYRGYKKHRRHKRHRRWYHHKPRWKHCPISK